MNKNNRVLLELVRSEWAMHPHFIAQLMPLAWKFANGEPISRELYKGYDDDGDYPDYDPTPWACFVSPKGQVLTAKEFAKSQGDGGYVAVISFSGVLTKYESSLTDGIQEKANLLNSIKNNPNVSAVVAKYDACPGGSVSAVERTAETMQTFPKPLLGYVEDYSCSAGCWLFTSNHEVYASHKNDFVGSIGVMASWMDVKGAYEKEGAKWHEYYAKQSTLKNFAFRQAEAGSPEKMIEELSVTCDDFISAVKKNRGTKLKNEPDSLFKGEVFSAQEAMSFGLIDGVLSFDAVVNRARELASKQFKRTPL